MSDMGYRSRSRWNGVQDVFAPGGGRKKLRMVRGGKALLSKDIGFLAEQLAKSQAENDEFKDRVSSLLNQFEELHHCLTKDIVKMDQALAEKNAEIERLKKLATHDGLTDLLNPRGIQEALDKLFAETNRGIEQSHKDGRLLVPQALVFIMIDLDHFKGANDTYGHATGDAVLKAVADQMRDVFKRPADIRGRKGGDEFIVAFPCDMVNLPKTAQDLSEKLRVGLESHCHVLADGSVGTPSAANPSLHSITGSIGVAFVPFEKATQDQLNLLIARADAASYESKADGRNTVFFALGGNDGVTRFIKIQPSNGPKDPGLGQSATQRTDYTP